MTAQYPEKITYNDLPARLCSQPLDSYFDFTDEPWPFERSRNTALWRGYIGTWELIADRLYLVNIDALSSEGKEVFPLDSLFPGFPNRVFAHWYSGTLRICKGKQVEYVHAGFGSTYEDEYFLSVEQGVIIKTLVEHPSVIVKPKMQLTQWSNLLWK